MAYILKTLLMAFLVLGLSTPAHAGGEIPFSPRTLGDPNAPIKMDEYMSITCSHCATFYLEVLPEIEEKYIKTGKVYLVAHDFPLNGISLRAATLAHCLPKEQYFPFIKTLYKALMDGNLDSEKKLYQYALLGGMDSQKAKACANDPERQKGLIANRSEALAKYNIDGTPTFVINDGEEIINGLHSAKDFAVIFERLLATHKRTKESAEKNKAPVSP